MTPLEILAEAKSRFVVLYHKDEANLIQFLRRTLGKFQDKAGVILETWQDEPVFELPPHFQGVAGCSDSKRRYLAWRPCEVGEGGEKRKAISLQTTSRHSAPYCLAYFCDLRNWPTDKELPKECAALLTDYLEALIAVPNTKREREAYLQSGMNDAAQTLQTEQELRQRISDLEREMEDNKAIIPPASMF